MRASSLVILFWVAVCVVTMLAEIALGADTTALDKAAADPATSVQSCTCVEGPLASEIEKLRTQIRLLKAEARVNNGIQRAAQRKEKKR